MNTQTNVAPDSLGDLHRFNVALLDDDDLVKKTIDLMIGEVVPSAKVYPCSDLEEFGKILDEADIDLCLVDHWLGETTGLDALDMVRGHESGRNAPVVMISGHEDADTIVRSIRAGCADFVSKSDLSVERLRDTIFTALSETLFAETSTEKLRAATDRTLRDLMLQADEEFRPRVRNIYGQCNVLRTAWGQDRAAAIAALNAIEDECMDIWRSLDSGKSYEGAGSMRTFH